MPAAALFVLRHQRDGDADFVSTQILAGRHHLLKGRQGGWLCIVLLPLGPWNVLPLQSRQQHLSAEHRSLTTCLRRLVDSMTQ